MQGRLREESLSVIVKTECSHCSRSMHIEIDSDLNYSVKEEGADPVIFIPEIDFKELEDPSIIEAF